MKESHFIDKNHEKWGELEELLENKEANPEALRKGFIQVTDDLSYSRTFYRNRSVRVYLNGLAQKLFLRIYKSKRSHRGAFVSFWTDELPYLVLQAKREFLIAFLIFFTAFAIGVLSSAMDPEFPRIILGDSYVEMTLKNIEAGDPMAVYKDAAPYGMTANITTNNLFVAFLTFIFGVFYAIGSIGVLITNGVMVGVFQYFFIERGVFVESFLTIWIHGTLEISSIIIAGAAGLTMGRGLVFPGTLPRLRSFQLSAKRGLKIMIGITPLIMLAGFFESYLTRHTEIPHLVRFIFILINLAFVLGYFVWYPRHKQKVGFKKLRDADKLIPDNTSEISFQKLKTTGEIFADTFVFFRRNARVFIMMASLLAGIYTIGAYFLSIKHFPLVFVRSMYPFSTVFTIGQYFKNDAIIFLFPLVVLTFSILFFVVNRVQSKASGSGFAGETSTSKRKFYTIAFIKTIVGATILVGILQTNAWYTFFLVVFVFPYITIWMYSIFQQKISLRPDFVVTSALVQQGFGQVLGLSLLLLLSSAIFFLIFDTQLVQFIINFIGMNFSMEQSAMDSLATGLRTFLILFLFFIMLIGYSVGFGFLFHSAYEAKYASKLKADIEKISLKKRIKGIEAG